MHGREQGGTENTGNTSHVELQKGEKKELQVRQPTWYVTQTTKRDGTLTGCMRMLCSAWKTNMKLNVPGNRRERRKLMNLVCSIN
jgi:hypothetical protein